jgi:hypothetical protein
MRAAILTIALLLSQAIGATIPAMSEDGWYRWQIEDPAGSHMYCWRGRNSYTSKCDELTVPGATFVYVHSRKGEIVDLRLSSAQCAIDLEADARDVGIIDNAESIAWLKALAEANTRSSEDATAAIAAHASEQALPVLISLIENKRLDQDVREQALFWLVQSDDDRAYGYLDTLLAER